MQGILPSELVPFPFKMYHILNYNKERDNKRVCEVVLTSALRYYQQLRKSFSQI